MLLIAKREIVPYVKDLTLRYYARNHKKAKKGTSYNGEDKDDGTGSKGDNAMGKDGKPPLGESRHMMIADRAYKTKNSCRN